MRRWGERVVSKCPLCSNHGTLEHILNFCSVSLNKGRFTWRHNIVLNHLTTTIIENKPENLEIYSDISGLDINGGTIPPDVLVTTSRPDLVLLNPLLHGGGVNLTTDLLFNLFLLDKCIKEPRNTFTFPNYMLT